MENEVVQTGLKDFLPLIIIIGGILFYFLYVKKRTLKTFNKNKAEESNLTIDEFVRSENLNKLQQTSDYRFLRKKLISAGIVSLLFAIVAIVQGINSYKINNINLFLVFLGVFLLFEGIWILFEPNPIKFIVNGITIIIVGSWNIFVLSMYLVAQVKYPAVLLILGIYQIYWGIDSYLYYYRFKNVPIGIPDGSYLQKIEKILTLFTQTKNDPNIILVQCKSIHFLRKTIWTGYLGSDFMVFIDRPGLDFIISGKENVIFKELGNTFFGRYFKIQISVKDRKITLQFKKKANTYFKSWIQEKI